MSEIINDDEAVDRGLNFVEQIVFNDLKDQINLTPELIK